MGVKPFLVASSLRIVMAQRLIRVICRNCKTESEPDKGLLKLLGLVKGTYYKGKGCDYCSNTGYAGRTAVIEMMTITENLSELIIQNVSANKLKKLAINEGMISLSDHALQKLKAGETTVEEVAGQILI